MTRGFYRLIYFAFCASKKRENVPLRDQPYLMKLKKISYNFCWLYALTLTVIIIVPICPLYNCVNPSWMFGSSGLWNAGKTYRSQEDLFGLQSVPSIEIEPVQKIGNENFKIIADSLEHIYAWQSAPSTYMMWAKYYCSYMAPLVAGERWEVTWSSLG